MQRLHLSFNSHVKVMFFNSQKFDGVKSEFSRDKTLMVSDFWLKTVDSLGPKESESGRMRHSRFLKRDILSLQWQGKETLYLCNIKGLRDIMNRSKILTQNVLCLSTKSFVLSFIQSPFVWTLSIETLFLPERMIPSVSQLSWSFSSYIYPSVLTRGPLNIKH